MSVLIKAINPLSSLQDYGVFHKSHLGISPSGAADEKAYLWGNYLLGNNFNSKSLEITLGMAELVFSSPCYISITGADFNFKLNNKRLSTYAIYKIEKNDSLICSSSNFGNYAYINISGGFQGNTNQILKPGDIIEFKANIKPKLNTIPMRFIPKYNNQIITVRVLKTYQYDYFLPQQQKLFFKQKYRLTKDCNKVACKLEGSPIKPRLQEIYSEGMSLGSIEITPNGMPIIMLKDSPTIGGYPKIATAFSLDLAKLAQYKTNTLVQFKIISLEEAERLRKEFDGFFNIAFASVNM